MEKHPTTTIGHLKSELAVYPDNFTVSFGGLEFYRFKLRDVSHVVCEFSQSVGLDREGRVVVEDHR